METLISVLISLGAMAAIITTLMANHKIPNYRRWVRLVQCALFLYISIAYALIAAEVLHTGDDFSTVVRPCWMLVLLSLSADRFLLARQDR